MDVFEKLVKDAALSASIWTGRTDTLLFQNWKAS